MKNSSSHVKSNTMHSQIGGSSISIIKGSNAIILNDPKFVVYEEMSNFDKFLGNTQFTQKDYNDMKKLGLNFKKFQNTDTYYGQTQLEKPHGYGIYVFWSMCTDKKPYFYKGTFQNGQYSGFGKLCKMVNQRQAIYCYQGNWKNGKREAEGRQNYNADCSMYYQGNWVNDKRQGHGIFVMHDGSFDGLWLNGRMNGEGTLTIQRGNLKTVIKGQWTDDQIAQGFINYYSKINNEFISKYQGGIRNLLRQGEGKYTVGTAEIQGTFRNDQIVGTCTVKQQNQDAQYTIKGDLNRPQWLGFQADIKYKNNDIYQGLIDVTPNHIIRRGKGKYFSSNGGITQGEFEDNDRGQFILKK